MREKPLVLLVDDEMSFLEIMAVKLGASGFDPVVAHNAIEAFDAAKKLRPDLILMDIHMPGETGTDAALAIRHNPETKNLKIAFLSSLKDPWPRTSNEPVSVAKEIGMVDFLDKGADLDSIVRRIKEIMAEGSA